MCRNIYRILTPRIFGSFEHQAESLFECLNALLKENEVDETAVVQLRFYLSDASNQQELLERREDYSRIAALGSTSSIEQPPLSGYKISALVWFVKGAKVFREVQTVGNTKVAVINIDNQYTYYLHTVREGADSEAGDSRLQTVSSFAQHISFLRDRGLTLIENCLRTWIYVRDVDRNYAGVVKGRNEVFALEGLNPQTHFIASTGIGGASACKNSLTAVDFLSVSNSVASRIGYLHATDYLNPTHEYGVAFERGAYIDLPGERVYYISGTASIDKYGECVSRGDILKQTERLFLNISKLLENGGAEMRDVQYFLVYLRDTADYRAVAEYMLTHFPNLPCLIALARVCRPEWLIEVECVAAR